MDFSRLRHRLYIVEPSVFTAGSYTVEELKQTGVALWGDVNPQSSASRSNQQRQTDQITHQITCRHRTDIEEGTNLLFGCRILRVVAPPRNMFERNRTMFLDCIEIESVKAGTK